jgi:hypothetical protein
MLYPVGAAAAETRLVAERLRAVRWVFAASFALITLGQLRSLAAFFFPTFRWIVTGLGLLGYLVAGAWTFNGRQDMNKSDERKLAYVFGVVFVVVLLVIALALPNPTVFQYTVFRIILALAAAGVASMIPGFLHVTVKTWIRASGALAIFVIVYFFSPVALVGP